jgi:hypothetical protein
MDSNKGVSRVNRSRYLSTVRSQAERLPEDGAHNILASLQGAGRLQVRKFLTFYKMLYKLQKYA